MTGLENALYLSSLGFHVFPLTPNEKTPPLITDFPNRATTHELQIKEWWHKWPLANIGISTTRFKESEALLVIDVDNKEDKMGEDELFRLEEIEGYDFPSTCEQDTPSGGRHIIYRIPTAIQQSASKIARGIDTRSRGGYIVGAGSTYRNGIYKIRVREVASAPEKLLSFFTRSNTKPRNATVLTSINQDHAISRALDYLKTSAPKSVQGTGGNETAFTVACRIKDFGVSEYDCGRLLFESEWNRLCTPPWGASELNEIVSNAYKYGENQIGSDAPEAHFKEVEKVAGSGENEVSDPISELNKEYAFVIVGGKGVILHEEVDNNGEKMTNLLDVTAFKQKIAAQKLLFGDKAKPVSTMWIESEKRRSYDGIHFYPGESKFRPNHYNLWKGFSVKPLKTGSADAILAFNEFLTHIRENVCGGDESLNHWLLNFCAHIIQKPQVKPMVALVFRGEKGVGKNFFVDQIGFLFRNNYMVTADDRYIVGNFNSHLEQCLMLVLDEAFWSGNFKAEGMIKSLVTERHHVIERKGKDAYKANNYARICILGNADQLVQSSNDERRFAVFDVGNAKKQDTHYFGAIAEGMNNGGRELLMSHLSDFKVDDNLINVAPQTVGLLHQKQASLHPVHQWWYECLTEGKIIGSNVEFWPETMSKENFWGAFRFYVKERQVKVWQTGNNNLIRILNKCLVRMKFENSKHQDSEGRINAYKLPELIKCRDSWAKWLFHQDTWDSSGHHQDTLNYLI